LSTASSSPSNKAKPPVNAAGASPGATEGKHPPAVGGQADMGTTSRRRPPLLVVALAAALAAAAYGHFVLGMRFGPPLVMVALGGLTLAFCAAALWRVIDPLTRGEVQLVAEARAPHRIRELEREKQAVLKAIKEIELDYQMRKISEADYREMVERYRTRALRVMGDLATGDDYRALIERELKHRLAARAAVTAGDGTPAPAPAIVGVAVGPAAPATAPTEPGAKARGNESRVPCAACAAPNDADAQFCKKCGHKLGSLAAPA